MTIKSIGKITRTNNGITIAQDDRSAVLGPVCVGDTCIMAGGSEVRVKALDAINAEREYQDIKWGGKKRSPAEIMFLIEGYIDQAREDMVAGSDTVQSTGAALRKIAALSVYCMEQCGVVPRI